MHLLIKNIKWDNTEEPTRLPELVLVLDAPHLIGDEEEERISDLLSDVFGFCHLSWEYEVFKLGHRGFFPENLAVCNFV